jgi:DNA-binding CsgD family transcriptional regulator/PAS domain-containing protein
MGDYQRLAHLDPAFAIMQDQPVGHAVNIQGPERHELESEEFYQGLRRKHDVGYVGGANVIVDVSQVVGLGLHRATADDAYDPATLDLISTLIPHLQRALRIHREFIRLRVQNSALSARLDNLMMGVVLFDHLGTPVYVNPVAESILSHHPAIGWDGESILPTRQEDAVALRRLLLSCLTPQSSEAERGGVLGLHHTDTPRPLVVMLRPVETDVLHNAIDGEPVYVAMYLSDTERPHCVSVEAISELYGLTRTEAQIAVSLANGQSVEEIAANSSRSVHTVRTHLKAIFNKTRTKNQADLVRLLLAGGVV